MTISLSLALAFFGVLTLLGVLFTNSKIEIPSSTASNDPSQLFKMREIILPEIKKPEPKIEQKKEAAPKTDNGQVKPEDDPTKNNIKTNIELNISKNANPNGKTDSAQTKGPEVPIDPLPLNTASSDPVTIPDVMPEFKNLQQYLANNLQYPRIAIENFTAGTVFITFVIEADGSVSNVKMLKGIGDGCEEEAIRVVKGMPNWKPGINHGKAVRVQFNLPVKFRIK